MRTLIASLKFFGLILNCIWIFIVQGLILLFVKGDGLYVAPKIWMKIWCWLFRIRVQVRGERHNDQQVIFMSNHISYLDIPALSSVVGNASFVAKSEVGTWPLARQLAALQRTAYIQRKKSKIAQEKEGLQDRINNGDNLIIFPEGTSTSGFDVLPFKSSLFILALGEHNENLQIQPVTIKVLSVDGKTPKSKDERDVYAWPFDVDIDLHHHMWRFAKSKGAELEITFHPPLKASEYSDRKVLAKDCYELVSKGLDVQKAA